MTRIAVAIAARCGNGDCVMKVRSVLWCLLLVAVLSLVICVIQLQYHSARGAYRGRFLTGAEARQVN